MTKRMTKSRRSSKPPRADKLPGPVKYKKPTGDPEPSLLEVASMRRKKKVVKKPR